MHNGWKHFKQFKVDKKQTVIDALDSVFQLTAGEKACVSSIIDYLVQEGKVVSQ